MAPVAPVAPRACALLTKADVEATGRKVASVDTDTQTRCTYLVDDGMPSVGLFIDTAQGFDAGRTLLGATPIDGLGFEAYWQVQAKALHVRVDASKSFFLQSTESKRDDVLPSLQRLVPTVAARMQ